MQAASSAAMARLPGRASLGTLHILEDLAQLLEGAEPLEDKRAVQVVDWMLKVFTTARLGLDFLKSPQYDNTFIMPPEKLSEFKHAIHFREILEGEEKAERLVRALESALEGWQSLRAAYDTPVFVFETKEIGREAAQEMRRLAEMAQHVCVLPDDEEL